MGELLFEDEGEGEPLVGVECHCRLSGSSSGGEESDECVEECEEGGSEEKKAFCGVHQGEELGGEGHGGWGSERVSE